MNHLSAAQFEAWCIDDECIRRNQSPLTRLGSKADSNFVLIHNHSHTGLRNATTGSDYEHFCVRVLV